ncbi:1922_t:CDS:2 [Cetraspora pellucida]|uniref:1922_t:CDS:1 n=1 Tax=Cetraspora pellucida TaxID=1433469 RepID=A0ACA9KSS3_9GLOM|nr:1922_t:CDS:2 [Cetraspora pellucida]
MKLYCLYIILLNFQPLYILVKAYIPIPRHLHSATLIGNKLYILGGDIGSTEPSAFLPSNDFFYLDVSVAFNTTNIPWTNLSGVIVTPKHSRAAVSTRDKIIFLFGGGFENSSYGIPLVYTFNTTKSMWNTIAIQGIQPPRRESIHSVIDATGKMYIFGGDYSPNTGNLSLSFDNRMDILDTVGLTWSRGSQLQAPSPRDAYSATLLPNDVIVYLGGPGNNPQNLREITIGTIPDARAHHTTVLGLNNDRLIVYGGYYTSSPLVHDLSVLDIRNKPYQWFIPNISGTIPPTPAYHTANVVGKYMIISYGFINSQGYANPDMYILDISNDFEYKWVTSFDPNPVSSPSPGHNDPSNSSNGVNSISTGTIVGAIIGTSLGSILFTVFAIVMIYRRHKKRKYAHAIPTHGTY